MASERDFRNALALVSRTVKSASADAMRTIGVHIGQNFLLDELWQEDRLTTGELAKRLGVEAPTITRMTQRMETAGLVTRLRDEHDRRVIRIALTAQGHALQEQLPALLDAVASQALTDLTADQREQLISLLHRVAANMT